MTLAIDTTITSPNYSDRNGTKIFMIVMHATAGRFRGDIDRLTDDKVPLKKRVSVHYYITRAGKVYLLVPEQYAAWHAGAAYWNSYGPVEIQQGSIGIELENLNNGIEPYPPEQYNAALELVGNLVARYQVAQTNLVTHQNIAGATEGKTDPRGFPWEKFKNDVLYGRWGDSYPLPAEQRGYGIPSQWAKDGGALGEAVSPPIYVPDKGAGAGGYAIQFFRFGYIGGFNRPAETYFITRFGGRGELIPPV